MAIETPTPRGRLNILNTLCLFSAQFSSSQYRLRKDAVCLKEPRPVMCHAKVRQETDKSVLSVEALVSGRTMFITSHHVVLQAVPAE